MASTPQYTELSARAKEAIKHPPPSDELLAEKLKQFEEIQPRPKDTDGSTEMIEGIKFTHHFISAPGDYETINWHYVTCGHPTNPAIVFLHGIPDSWYQWHPQMAALSHNDLCVGVDLKGYGQSEKSAGDYTNEGAANQPYTVLQQVGFKRFFLVTDDRGSVQGDFITAKHPHSVLGYARGENHLFHFNPVLVPKEEVFRNSPWSGVMEHPKREQCCFLGNFALVRGYVSNIVWFDRVCPAHLHVAYQLAHLG